MDRVQEIEAKVERVRSLLAAEGLAALALGTQANFAWVTAGGDNHVGLSSEGGVATVLITPTARHVIASSIETPRIGVEEIAGLGFELHVHPWHSESPGDVVGRLVGAGDIGADCDLAGARTLGSTIARLRWQLLPPEVERYRAVGRESVRVLGETAHAAEPGMSELEIAGIMQGKAFAAGLLPNVCLIATDERAFRYRHPVPTGKRLERHLMLVVGARRGGLCVSATRMVHFGPPPEELVARHQAVCAVDACLILGSRPGARVTDVFGAACAEYARQGYPDEWLQHHQGGATGYAAREYRAGPTSDEVVLDQQAFAWNPSIAGTKSEDTIVATDAGPEALSPAIEWPMVTVRHAGHALDRPAIMVR